MGKADGSYAAVHGEIGAVMDRLLPGERFEDNIHLAQMSLAQVVDWFWPSADGWTVTSMEPAHFWPLWILEHPTRGVAASIIGATEAIGGTGTPETWEGLDVFWRARNIHVSNHIRGASRLAIVQALASRERSDALRSADEALTVALLDSPVFMDDTVCTMRALGAFADLTERAAQVRARTARLIESRITDERIS